MNTKPISGYEGFYSACDDGRIWSEARTIVGGCSSVRDSDGAWLRPFLTRRGYLKVALWKNGTVKKHYVHRLIAGTWIENQKDAPQVNHIDGVRTNNAVANLEWCTGKENVRHAMAAGRFKPGRKPKTKLGEGGEGPRPGPGTAHTTATQPFQRGTE